MTISNDENLSLREFGTQVVERLNTHWGIRLDTIINNEALTLEQRKRLLVARMLEAALSKIDEHNWQMGFTTELHETENRNLIERALKGDDPELEPNISVTEHNFRILRNYQGQEIKNYLVQYTKRFEAMAQAKTPGQLAIDIVSASLVSVGTAMAKGAITAWRAGQPLLQAVRTGITSIGMKTAITVVVIVLAALLLYLFLENPKKILAMIFNDTDEDLIVKDWRKGVDGRTGGDLYLEHGHMENFPEDHATGALDSPLVQLRQRAFFGPNDPENVVFGGFYFGDRNFGLRGVEGVMLFSSKTTNLMVAHQFAVPYTNDNGTNMRLLTERPRSFPDLFRDMYNQRRVRVDLTTGGYRLVSAVNDPRGGVVGLMASISKA